MLLFNNDGKNYLVFNMNSKYLVHVRKYKKKSCKQEPSVHRVYILVRKQVPVDKLGGGTESQHGVPLRFIGATVWGRTILLTDKTNKVVGLIISTFESIIRGQMKLYDREQQYYEEHQKFNLNKQSWENSSEVLNHLYGRIIEIPFF